MARKILILLVILILCAALISAGCTVAQSGSSTAGGQSSAQKTPATPVPSVGTIKVTSTPWGASVYLDGTYRGSTPLNITDVPVGKHEVRLSMPDYATVNGTVDVKAGQIATFSQTMTLPKPDVKGTLTKTQYVYGNPCKWIFSGTLTNSGEISAQELTLTATMNPTKSGFATGSKTVTVGTVEPGKSRSFYVEVPVDCGGEYKGGSISFRYKDKYDKSYSGSIAL
ncbi:MAG: PEGA domain-containing protein [Methanomicrobiales archaeon]|nr:PEGA domain-containing protein [Methanomicrobiales archaeon]